MTYVGKDVLALESVPLLRGQSKYVDDFGEPDSLFLGVVRSPYAHARIRKIDATRAKENSPLIVTREIVEQCFGKVRLPADSGLQGNIVRMPALAESKVNYVGEPVLGIVGKSRYEAEDLIDLISIEYDELPPVRSVKYSPSQNIPIIHEGANGNLCIEASVGSGDVDSVFKEADVVVEDELEVHRIAPNPIEPRGVCVNFENGRFTVVVSCQGVFYLKRALCEATGIPPEKLRVLQAEVGGAFGAKSAAYPEYVLALAATKVLGKPVKWIETRSESLVATQHGRDVQAKLSLAATKEGKMLGLKGTVIGDIGAYNFSVNANHAMFVAQQLAGPYDIKAARIQVKSVFTNKTPTGPYRGAGRPEAAFFIERMVDLLSDETGIDRIELRRRNLVKLNQMPHQTPLGLTLDPEDYEMLIENSMIRMNYNATKKWVESQKQNGRMIGLGFADYVEINRTSVPESALVKIDPSGVTVVTGLGPHGQGHKTIISQLIADEFDILIDRVKVLYGDSDLMAQGVGTFGSRSSTIGCAAVVSAAREVKKKVFEEAASVLHCSDDDLEFSDFAVRKRSDPRSRISLSALPKTRFEASTFLSAKDIFSFGTHLCVVEVDKETGLARVLQYYAVDDSGRTLNPLIADGQIYGGILMGLGQVLYEGLDYNEIGQPIEGSIGDAGVPTSIEAPNMKSSLLEYPSQLIHHSRGIGEAGTIGSLPAVVRAVEDAIGVRLRTTHLSQENLRKVSETRTAKLLATDANV